MPMSLLCEGADGRDEAVVSGVADATKNFVWHERKTSEILGEIFAMEVFRHLPPPLVKPFPKCPVVFGTFVLWFHR